MIISASKPTCEPIVRHTSVAENQAVDFTCRMTFKWHTLSKVSNIVPYISVSFGWDSETHSNMALTSSNSSELTIVRNTSVVGAKPAIPTHKCTISFTFAPQSHPPSHSFAVNPVSYTCSSDPIPVRCKFSLYTECDPTITKPFFPTSSAIDRLSKIFY